MSLSELNKTIELERNLSIYVEALLNANLVESSKTPPGVKPKHEELYNLLKKNYDLETGTYEIDEEIKKEEKRIKMEKSQLLLKSNVLWVKMKEDQKSPLMLWCEEIRRYTRKIKTMPAGYEYAYDEFCLQKIDEGTMKVQLKFTVTSLLHGQTLKLKISELKKGDDLAVTSSVSPVWKFMNDYVTSFLLSGKSCEEMVNALFTEISC